MKPTVLVLSCEHAVNKVPARYAHLFAKKKLILKTHRAFDFGAIEIATAITKQLHCDFVSSKVSRLLIDCDHSLHHANCFSKFSKKLPESEKNALIEKYYDPFHQTLKETISHHIAQQQQVLHISLYTFMPILKGVFLNTGISVLYDSHRHAEKEVARIFHGLLMQEPPCYKIRLNYPFPGTHDYVLQSLRHVFAEKDYLGIKLGINQALISTPQELHTISHGIIHSMQELLALL
ncbi:MAG TPA: N-formylglutamate amidohydrolase [Legionellaceae bacterium]|nr:N-formylglutamate amidohydrolase [Legionellaceae bacterium]